MPTTSQLRIPPILDADLFEDFCRDLWASIWNDPEAERNGRKGQSQCGVDVFGLPAGEKQYEGVQAKAYALPLTTAQIQHEIDEAKKFTPPLRKLIIACTASRDAPGQAYVRQINLDHRAGNLFSVTLLGWDDIKLLIQTHWAESRPDLIERYFEITTTSGILLAGVAEVAEKAVSRIAGNSASAVASMNALPALINQEHYHAELNYARSLINEAKPQQALTYLSSCWDRIWSNANPAVRYRLLHYKGCANCQLERTEESGRFLIEALQYNPEDETAFAFAALGALMLGDNENAARYARQALIRNPSNAKAYATLVNTLDVNLTFESIIGTVPSAYRKLAEVANAFASMARRKDMLAEAEQWCRTAIECDRENWADPHGVLGELLMQQVLEDGPLLPFRGVSGTKRARLEEAEGAFSQAWERVSRTEINHSRVSWLVNRSAVRLLLEKPAEASEDLDLALRLKPDDPMLILRRAHLGAQLGETVEAVALLRRVPLSAENTEQRLMLADLLVEMGNNDEAEQVLDRLTVSALPETAALSAERLRMRIEVQRKDWPKAEELFKDMHSRQASNIDVLVDGAWLFRMMGDRQSSLSLLAEATGLITAASAVSQRHALATECFEGGQFAEAASLYGHLADRDINGPLTRRWLVCLYNSGDLEQALNLSQHMIARHGPLPVASPVAVSILNEVGDLTNAKRIADEYLTLYPDDWDMQLRLASVLQRSGDTAGIDAFLDQPINLASLTMPMALQVAGLYIYRGRMEQALSIAYEVRRKYMGESEAHIFYVSLFFNARTDSDEEQITEMSVGLDTAVCLRDGEGKEEWHIIEERDDHKLPAELSPDHGLARKMLGMGVGAVITLKANDFSTETATISAIQSKFSYAMQESMRTYERMFPDAPGLWNMRLPTVEGGTEGIDVDLDPFFRMISQKHQRTQSIERVYREGKLPLGMVAKLLNQNIIQTWSTAVSRPDVGIQCSHGTPGELVDARKMITDGIFLVLEPVALLTLYRLDARDVLSHRFGRFAIPQSLIDMIQHARHECTGMGSNGFMTVGMEGDQFVRQEITRENVQANVEYLDGLLAWIQENCDITPITSALSESRSLRTKLKDMMEVCFADSILIASEPGRILYSDDERFRALADGEKNVKGVWTQVLLDIALSENLITQDNYGTDVIRLVASQYRFVQITPAILLLAARKAEWRPVHPFLSVSRVLSGPNCESASAIMVAVEAIYGVWNELILDHQRSSLVVELLNSLTKGRDRIATISVLLIQLKKRFYLLPLHYESVRRLIAAWTHNHVI